MHPAVFLDRDNTLIHNDGDLGDPARVRLVQGAATAVASLCGLGYKVVVITNQGGVARGAFTEEDVEAVHARIRELLEHAANGAKIERFYYCPFHPEGSVTRYRREHPNRKPQPGMLIEAARELGLDLSRSWTIGDQVRDVQAGIAAGTRTILLRPDADELDELDPQTLAGVEASGRGDEPSAAPTHYARSLVEAVRIIAQHRKPESNEDAMRARMAGRRWDAAAVARLQRPKAVESETGDSPRRTVVRTRPARGGESKSASAGETGTAPAAASAPAESAVGEPSSVTLTPGPTATSRSAAMAGAGVAETAVDETPAPDAAPGSERETESRADADAGVGAVAESAEGAEAASRRVHQADATSPAIERTLRLILQELRQQRGEGGDFSYLTLCAIVMQLVAGVCLLGGLWMGASDDPLFLRWLLAGLLVQGATITLLLFGRR